MMLPDWSCCCLLREYALMILMSPPQTCRWFWQWRSDAFSTCNLTSGASTFHPSPGNLARVTSSVLTGKGRNHKKSKKMNTKAKTMEWKHALCSGWIAGQVFMIPKHYALLDKYFFGSSMHRCTHCSNAAAFSEIITNMQQALQKHHFYWGGNLLSLRPRDGFGCSCEIQPYYTSRCQGAVRQLSSSMLGFAIRAEGALATETAKYLAFLLHTAINRPKEERIWEDWIFAAPFRNSGLTCTRKCRDFWHLKHHLSGKSDPLGKVQNTVKCQDERTARDFLIQNLGSPMLKWLTVLFNQLWLET